MALEYYWRRITKFWNFSLFGRRISLGFWLHIARDRVLEDKSLANSADATEKPYRYLSLDKESHIRVLELSPGRHEDPLRGRLIHNPNDFSISTNRKIVLDWSVKYEALSYVWGLRLDYDQRSRIILDDQYYLPVLPNLDIALRHLRSEANPRIIWVDAICINQEDMVERSTQVNMMQKIFSRAQTVDIWLGENNENTPMGMNILRYLAESTFDETPPWVKAPDPRFLEGYREILQREWFNRIWVVQEAAVSQKAVMMCGSDSFEWTNDPFQLRKFIRRVKYAAISPQWEQAGLSEVNVGRFLQVLNLQLQHIERERQQVFTLPTDILDVAFETRHRKSGDPRDKLFALLGLVDPSTGANFVPDYLINTEEVFQRLLDSIEI